jgi:hypothetical protein
LHQQPGADVGNLALHPQQAVKERCHEEQRFPIFRGRPCDFVRAISSVRFLLPTKMGRTPFCVNVL